MRDADGSGSRARDLGIARRLRDRDHHAAARLEGQRLPGRGRAPRARSAPGGAILPGGRRTAAQQDATEPKKKKKKKKKSNILNSLVKMIPIYIICIRYIHILHVNDNCLSTIQTM